MRLRALAAGLVTVSLVLGGWGWTRFREQRVEDYRARLVAASAGVPPYRLRDHYFRRGELRAAAARSFLDPAASRSKPPYDDPLAAIVDFQQRLAERGTELWVVPVPLRPWIAPRVLRPEGQLGPGASAYSRAFDDFVAALREEGVETIELLPHLQSQAVSAPSDWMHLADPHWTGNTVVYAAQELAKLARERSWYEGRSLKTKARWTVVRHRASVGGTGAPEDLEAYPIDVRKVHLLRDGKRVPLGTDDQDARIIVMGDSHAHWYKGLNGDIARQLSHELGIPVERLSIAGGGANRVREELARRSWEDPQYFSKKSVVVWVFWSELLHSDAWNDVPLEHFEASLLERRSRGPQLSDDTVLLEKGRGLASLNFRWGLPQLGSNQEVAVVRMKGNATLDFPVESGFAELILETRVAEEPMDVPVTVDGVELEPLDLPLGFHRVRIPLRGKPVDGRHRLEFQVETPGRFGLRQVTAIRSGRLANATFDTGQGYRVHTEKGVRYAVDRQVAEVNLTLEDEVPQETVLRLRLRALGAATTATVTVNGAEVARGVPLPLSWDEHAIPVPGGEWRVGENEVLVELDDPKARMAWDVLEVDRR